MVEDRPAETIQSLARGLGVFRAFDAEHPALPHLQQLAETVDETVSAAVLDGDHIVYVGRVAARRVVRVQVRTGVRFPAEATAMGRALLAGRSEEWLDGFLASITPERREGAEWLSEQLAVVRERGYAVVDQELEQGLRSVAVAVRDRDGHAVAAVDVATAAGPGVARAGAASRRCGDRGRPAPPGES